MGESTEWIDKKYQQVYEEELLGLTRRRAHDPSCTIEEIQSLLENLYVMDGNNYDGRSEVQQTAITATIDAYETFVSDWKKETGQ